MQKTCSKEKGADDRSKHLHQKRIEGLNQCTAHKMSMVAASPAAVVTKALPNMQKIADEPPVEGKEIGVFFLKTRRNWNKMHNSKTDSECPRVPGPSGLPLDMRGLPGSRTQLH